MIRGQWQMTGIMEKMEKMEKIKFTKMQAFGNDYV